MKKLLIAILLSGSLFFGSSLVISTVTQPAFAQGTEAVQLNIGEIAQEKEVIGTTDYDPEDGSAGFGALVSQILRIIIIFAVLMLLINLIWGGLNWISSGGDKSKIENARNRITQSIIGIIVLAGVIALFAIMQTAFNFEIFTFTPSAIDPTSPSSVDSVNSQNSTNPARTFTEF